MEACKGRGAPWRQQLLAALCCMVTSAAGADERRGLMPAGSEPSVRAETLDHLDVRTVDALDAGDVGAVRPGCALSAAFAWQAKGPICTLSGMARHFGMLCFSPGGVGTPSFLVPTTPNRTHGSCKPGVKWFPERHVDGASRLKGVRHISCTVIAGVEVIASCMAKTQQPPCVS